MFHPLLIPPSYSPALAISFYQLLSFCIASTASNSNALQHLDIETLIWLSLLCCARLVAGDLPECPCSPRVTASLLAFVNPCCCNFLCRISHRSIARPFVSTNSQFFSAPFINISSRSLSCSFLFVFFCLSFSLSFFLSFYLSLFLFLFTSFSLVSRLRAQREKIHLSREERTESFQIRY